MALFSTTAQNPTGFNAGRADTGRVTIRGGAVTKGQIVTLTLTASVDLTEATVAGTGQDIEGGFLGVALEGAAQNASVRVAIRGLVDVKTGSNIAVGTAVTVGANGLAVAAATGDDVIGYIRSAQVAGPDTQKCYFNGIERLGAGFTPA